MQIAHQKGAMDDEMVATLAYGQALQKKLKDEVANILKRERVEKKQEMKSALSTKAT